MTVKPAEYLSDFKQTSRILLLGLCSLFLFTPLLPLKTYAQQGPRLQECIPTRMSFIQPWDDEYFPNHELWHSEFLIHQRLGIDEIILQWTRWGDDLGEDIKLPAWLETAIIAADQSGAQIWFGLHYDPTFIENLKDEGQPYLDRRLQQTRELASLLKAEISDLEDSDKIFAGWYIPDEIDSELLLDSKHRQLITHYTTQTRIALNEILPGPVAISGYTDLKNNPQKLAFHWHNLMAASSMDILLLQDGLGAKLMEPYSSRRLQRAINSAFHKQSHEVIPVVEIFEIDPRSIDFRTIPTSMNTMKSRLRNARFSDEQPVALFSLSSHILKFDNKHSRDIAEFLAGNAQACDNTHGPKRIR